MISNKINTGLHGLTNIPGDKSISHRSLIISSISNGICEIDNMLMSEDVIHTMNAFKLMDVRIEEHNQKIIVNGNGLNSLKKPKKNIYLGNSGTSARLLTGLLASQNFNSIIEGDKSLSSRPMKRITSPLKEKMGAMINTTNGCLPIEIINTKLVNNEDGIVIDIPSAQIKSGLILAALNTKGKTKIIEKNITRDHSEIMLEYFNADIDTYRNGDDKIIEITGKKELKSKNINVPSDLSSAAFFIVASLININSSISLQNVNINPTRNGILIALERMGAKINYKNKRTLNNEKVCDIEVESSLLNGCDLEADIAKLMIDEYPILSIAASFATTPSVFRGLSELRVKESDRLKLIELNLKKCGVDCKVINDDLYINPLKNIKDGKILIQTDYDHRIAMAFAIMGSKIGSIEINESECINTSFPNFKNMFNKMGGNIS